MIRIVGCVIEDNRGDGIRIEGDHEVDIVNTSAHRNGGHGLNVRSEMAVMLSHQFPVLEGADGSLFDDLMGQARARDGEVTESFLKSTALGKWLERQSFVDWAQLALAVASFLPR